MSLPTPTKIVMLPSVGGGIGHISRTAALARALADLDATVEIEYLLDVDRLRPFNIDATRQMGFRPRFLPSRNRENRDAIVRACLDDAHLVVDDCSRYLLPLRHAVPHVGWVTLAMHPIGDELFLDWPFMAQMDAVIWAYAPLVGLPPELDAVADKVVQTGPFLETDAVPARKEARARLGLPATAPLVVYAPRGFPFGREFGHRVLSGLFRAVEALRRDGHPELELILLAVSDPNDLRGIPDVPNPLPDWVRVKGIVTPQQSLLYTRSADVVLGEGTSTMHEAAALSVPLILVPGPIQEATLLAHKLDEMNAATLIELRDATPARFRKAISAALKPDAKLAATLKRARSLVTGGGGVKAAAALVLEIARRYQAQAPASAPAAGSAPGAATAAPPKAP